MADFTPPTRQLAFREDCWSEEATSTLVDAWGRRYVELNRGNLRQKDWQEVSDAVNHLHGRTEKSRRTDVQCKNRIDTLKKKYKVEKAKIVEFDGKITSSWPFFARLDALIGPNYEKLLSKVSPLGLGFRNSPSMSPDFDSPPMAVPLPHRNMALPPPPAAMLTLPNLPTLPQKRTAENFRRNYSAMAAAAAKEVMEESEESEEEEEEEEEEEMEGDVEEEGMRKLAKEIERFGEIYERVEEMKQRQMVELEKQRLQFKRELEVQRMQMFMDTQVQLEKIKRAKHSAGGSDDGIDDNISEVFQQFNQFICNFM